MDVIIIGGGPAGMMAGVTSKEQGNNVTILEKNNILGKKLLITGKGRCNITSSLDISEFIENIPGNGMFLYSAFKTFTNKDIIEFLKKQGLEVKEERGHRIFPVTDKSVDVLNCFKKRLKELNVNIRYDENVNEVLTENIDGQEKVIGVKTNKEKIKCDKVILATGGKSYHLTGSTGDGYVLAQKLGHTITKIKPSLVSMEVYEKEICKELQGLSLRNVNLKFIDTQKNKIIYEEQGEMIFTHFGISGPVVLSASAHLVRYKNIDELLREKKIKLSIDLKPALNEEILDKRILRDFSKFKNKEFKNSLDELLPKKMIGIIIKESKIDEYKRVNEITKLERKNIIQLFKNFELTISKFRPIDEAIITSGGVNIKEVNPKTMESKLVKGLYFAGEILDVDGYTGGFNLQIAYSTGYVAGMVHRGQVPISQKWFVGDRYQLAKNGQLGTGFDII